MDRSTDPDRWDEAIKMDREAGITDDTCHGRCEDLRLWFAWECRGFMDADESHTVLDMLLNRLVAAEAVPDTGQATEPVMTETTRKLARRVSQYRRETLGWLKQAIRADGEAKEATGQSREPASIYDDEGSFHGVQGSACEHRTVGSHRAWCHDCREWCYPSDPCVRCKFERPGDTVQTSDVAARPGLCPTCGSSQPHLHPHRDLCPDSWHQPVPTTADEWRTEVHRWAGLLDQTVEHDIGSDAVRRLSGDMRRALLGTDTTPGEKR